MRSPAQGWIRRPSFGSNGSTTACSTPDIRSSKIERDSTGKRVAQAATGREQFTPNATPVEGNAALRFSEPSWSELRGLSADERQIVLEYFKRINAQSPQTPPTH